MTANEKLTNIVQSLCNAGSTVKESAIVGNQIAVYYLTKDGRDWCGTASTENEYLLTMRFDGCSEKEKFYSIVKTWHERRNEEVKAKIN